MRRPKVVRYFAMDPDGGTFVPGDEVDELQWVPAADAGDLLTYDHDRRVLAASPDPGDVRGRLPVPSREGRA